MATPKNTKGSKSSTSSKGSTASKRTGTSGARKAAPAAKVSQAQKAPVTPKKPKAPKLPQRYHPWLVTLHWVSAVLIIGNLLFGTFVLKITPNDAGKVPLFIVHITVGLTILVLTIVRFGVRLRTKLPAPATTGNRFLDAVGVATHWLLYLGAFGMGVSGLVAALQAHLFQSVFLGQGEIPIDLYVFAPRVWHGYLALGMYAIIALHIGAALFHLVIRRENLLARMWFGKK